MSHLLGLALVAYAKIAIIFIQSQSRPPGAADESDQSPESSGRQFLLGYQTSDFCKIVHATRTHSLSYSKTLFETIIAPAYYDAHLRAPLTSIRSIFESHQPWRGTAQQAAFVQSELFSPVFFRNLIGCFSTNTLEVIVDGAVRGSALFSLFSKMNHACRKNTANVDCEAASVQVVASQAIACGEEITTTYRFDESGCPSAAAAYIARKRALDQYLFRCACNVNLTCMIRQLELQTNAYFSGASAYCVSPTLKRCRLKDLMAGLIQAVHVIQRTRLTLQMRSLMLPKAKPTRKRKLLSSNHKLHFVTQKQHRHS
jgi:hypothetical protein